MANLDDKDSAMRDRRVAAWNRVPGPRVGDFCLRADGTETRFTYDHGDQIQTTTPQLGPGSFYFADGWMDYSGGLDPGIPKERLEDTGETRPGAAWFFHHDQAMAHNGVAVVVACRVYRERPAAAKGVLLMLRDRVSGAIERGEATPIVEVPAGRGE